MSSIAVYATYKRAYKSEGEDFSCKFLPADQISLEEAVNLDMITAEGRIPISVRMVKVKERTIEAVREALNSSKVVRLL